MSTRESFVCLRVRLAVDLVASLDSFGFLVETLLNGQLVGAFGRVVIDAGQMMRVSKGVGK